VFVCCLFRIIQDYVVREEDYSLTPAGTAVHTHKVRLTSTHDRTDGRKHI